MTNTSTVRDRVFNVKVRQGDEALHRVEASWFQIEDGVAYFKRDNGDPVAAYPMVNVGYIRLNDRQGSGPNIMAGVITCGCKPA